MTYCTYYTAPPNFAPKYECEETSDVKAGKESSLYVVSAGGWVVRLIRLCNVTPVTVQKVYCSSSWLFFGRIWLMIDN